MPYTLRALRVGSCLVREDVVFSGGSTERSVPFLLYIWLIRGEGITALVDTGPKDVEAFNRATAYYIPGGIVQEPEERTPAALAAAGVDPAEVDYVLLTHLHGDHSTHIDLFPNATVVTQKRPYLEALERGIDKALVDPLLPRWPDSIMLVEGEALVAPGLSVFWVGGHSRCSQAIHVETPRGAFTLAGDAAYLFRNIEENIPIGWTDPQESLRALERLRAKGGTILPGHDPEILVRYPGGVIA